MEFTEQVIRDGMEATRKDYAAPHQKLKLEGSLMGFEECRGKNPQELQSLLKEARGTTMKKYRFRTDGGVEEYWKWRCRELEIEWVCNCVSAVLRNQNLCVIVTPTYRGVMKAREILKEV